MSEGAMENADKADSGRLGSFGLAPGDAEEIGRKAEAWTGTGFRIVLGEDEED